MGKLDGVEKLVLAVMGLALCLWVAAPFVADATGLWRGEVFAGFWEQVNWAAYPAWFSTSVPLAFVTWRSFVAAWAHMFDSHVMRVMEGVDPPAARKEFFAYLGRMRRKGCAYALLLTLLFTASDAAEVAGVWIADVRRLCCEPAPPSSETERAAKLVADAIRGCREPNDPRCTPAELLACRAHPFTHEGPECDFFIAGYFHPSQGHGLPSKAASRNLGLLAYAIQACLAWIAMVAGFQLLGNTVLFCRLTYATRAKRGVLSIKLDPYSRVHELGLERWNHALNNAYWLLSPVLIAAIASRDAQLTQHRDFGQILLSMVLLAGVGGPMIATIATRQQLLPEMWAEVEAATRNDVASLPDAQKQYLRELAHSQRVWPLTRDAASKLGLVIALVLLGYFLGLELTMLF